MGPSKSASVTALTSGFHEAAIFGQGVLPVIELLVHRDPEQLASWERAIVTFLLHELRLELNPAARRLAPVSNGVDALGYIVWAHHKRLRARTVRRFEAVLASARVAVDWASGTGIWRG